MKIPLERHSSTPIYLQIRDRLSRLIQSGKLEPGERLPSIRALSASLQVNKLTVIEAYSLLEADGLIHARQGAGYFVNRTVLPSVKLRLFVALPYAKMFWLLMAQHFFLGSRVIRQCG